MFHLLLLHIEHFYPPALASGNHLVYLHRVFIHFYPPALASGNIMQGTPFGQSIFLSTRSCEREYNARHSIWTVNISIHPLLRAGIKFRSLNKEQKISIHPLLRAGIPFCPHTLGMVQFLSTRSCEREYSARIVPCSYIFLSTRSCERECCPMS